MLTVIAVINAIGRRFGEWAGTAAELADAAAELLPQYGLATEPVPNERLVRYYVTEGVLSRPTKEGREAKFGFRQLLEFLVARLLLADKWGIDRIADFNATADEETLLSLLPDSPVTASEGAMQSALPASKSETEAERLVREFAGGGYPSNQAYPRNRPQKPSAIPASQVAPPEQVRQRAQQRLTDEERKKEIKNALQRLGVPAESPPRADEIRWTIAPWCEVRVNVEAFLLAYNAAVRESGDATESAERLTEDALRVFRAALEGEITRQTKRKA